MALGANLGDARAALLDAFQRLDALPDSRLVRRSSIYRTAPIDSSGPDYLNAVAEVSTGLAPHRTARAAAVDRARPWPRTPLPERAAHARPGPAAVCRRGDRHRRPDRAAPPDAPSAFVLHPLAEIAPGLVIPGHGAVEGMLPTVADQRIDRLPA